MARAGRQEKTSRVTEAPRCRRWKVKRRGNNRRQQAGSGQACLSAKKPFFHFILPVGVGTLKEDF